MSAERTVTFVGTCVGLPAICLNEYDDTARDIAYATFRRHLGKEVVDELEESMGYGKPLRLKDDWAVSFSRGRWRGKKAVCMMHSSIHHIWKIE